MQNNKFATLFLLLIVCFFAFFIHNEVIYPDIMESRNIVTARDMVHDNNWLVPTMNGELRLEKPPLPTWLVAVCELVSPDNLFLQRALSGIMATILVFFLFAFGKSLTGKRLYGLFSALILCTSFNIILQGRTASWDIYCHSFMLGAIWMMFRGFQETGKRRKDFIYAGILLGLSFLGKGPVSFYALLLPFLVSYFLLYRPSLKEKGGSIILMIVICLAISLWWPAYLYFAHRDITLAVWQKESTAWVEKSVRPWWYYWKFFLESGIWSVFLITSLLWFYWKKKVVLKKEYLLCALWTFAVLFFLSLLPEKKTRYLLPILIPASLTIGHLFLYWADKMRKRMLPKPDKWVFRINIWIIAIISFSLPVALNFLFYSQGHMSLAAYISLSLFLAGVSVLFIYAAIKVRPGLFMLPLLLLFIGIESFLLPYISTLFNNPDIKSIRETRKITAIQDIPFYQDTQEEVRIEIIYEAGKKILPLDLRDSTEVFSSLPFVLISKKPAEEMFSTAIHSHLKFDVLGIYDDNKRQKNTSFYSPVFIHHATLISLKE